MVESGKTSLSSQFVQLPNTSTNFHRPSTSRSKKLTKALNPTPLLPRRERIQYGYLNDESTTFAYSTHQVSSRFLHSKRFPRFLISPSNSPQCQQIWSVFEMRSVRFKYFPRFLVPPQLPSSPNDAGSGRDLK